MEITWHGHNCFLIKGDDATVLIDPFEGVKLPSGAKVDITILTNEDRSKIAGESDYCFDWPGEYEAKGVAIALYPIKPTENEILVAQIAIDGYNCANLGFTNQTISNELAEKLGDLDIMMIPTGGGAVLKPKDATDVIETIEPKVIIPTCVAAENHGEEYEPVANFVKESGITMPEPTKKYKVPALGSLPTEHSEYVIIEVS